jgi:para-nitrobenzyl esterase
MSEDCLFLNIWSPQLGKSEKRPVMVWLHPGGFDVGAGNSRWSDGTNLARNHDVVVVSLNHRLNIFGRFYLADMCRSKYSESGVVGMLDIVAALTWIHDNISHFGGDSDNVTIFGESGGGGKVSVLMAMPPARGLFHKAIIQSGALIRATPAYEAAALTAHFLSRLNCSQIDDLHHLPPEKLLEILGAHKFRPVVGADSLPRHPFDPDAPQVSSAVPLLIGVNEDDGTYFSLSETPPNILDDASLRRSLIDMLWSYGLAEINQVESFIDVYRAMRPDASARELFFTICNDIFFDDATILAERKAAQSAAPAFMYVFAWRSPASGGRYGASHAFEIPFVFDNVDAAHHLYGADLDPRRYDLAATVSRTWATFAHNGNPNHAGLPTWDRYTDNQRKAMIINYSCAVIRDPRRHRRNALEKLRPHRMAGLTTTHPDKLSKHNRV